VSAASAVASIRPAGGHDVSGPRLPPGLQRYATLLGITEQLLTSGVPEALLAPLAELDDAIQLLIAANYGPEVVEHTAELLATRAASTDGPIHEPLEAALLDVAKLLLAQTDEEMLRLGVALQGAVTAVPNGSNQPHENHL
jgi:hypothetical protein